MYTDMYTDIYTDIYTHIYTDICTDLYTYIYTNIYTDIHTEHRHIHRHIYCSEVCIMHVLVCFSVEVSVMLYNSNDTNNSTGENDIRVKLPKLQHRYGKILSYLYRHYQTISNKIFFFLQFSNISTSSTGLLMHIFRLSLGCLCTGQYTVQPVQSVASCQNTFPTCRICATSHAQSTGTVKYLTVKHVTVEHFCIKGRFY